MLAEENIRRGMTPQEAYRQARIKFGNVESMKERYRDQRGLPFLDTTAQDLRYTVRVLSKNRGFATVAILSLAIGIGANTAIFSLVNGVLLQPLAYRDPDRLFAVRTMAQTRRVRCFPGQPGARARLGEECPSLEHVAVLRHLARTGRRAGSEPATLPGARVTHNFFTLLGVEPMLGRTFLPEEEQPGRDRVDDPDRIALAIARFNADPVVVGTIDRDGRRRSRGGRHCSTDRSGARLAAARQDTRVERALRAVPAARLQRRRAGAR